MMSRILQFGSSFFTAAAVVLFALGLVQSTNPVQAGPPPVTQPCGTYPTCDDTAKCDPATQTCEINTNCPCKLNGPK